MIIENKILLLEDDNTLSVTIRRLRKKIEADPSNPKHLITVRGFGYEWREAKNDILK